MLQRPGCGSEARGGWHQNARGDRDDRRPADRVRPGRLGCAPRPEERGRTDPPDPLTRWFAEPPRSPGSDRLVSAPRGDTRRVPHPRPRPDRLDRRLRRQRRATPGRLDRRSPATCARSFPNTRRPSPNRSSAVMADIERVVVPGLTQWQHPGFFAYFPANTSFPSILGELLSAGLGVQGMSWVTSPACTEVETLMLDWMQELLDLPERLPIDQRHRRRRDPGHGERGDAGRDPVGTLAGHGRRGQPRRRHHPARRVRHLAGALEHREGAADRRHRHRPDPDRPPRRRVRDARRRARRDDRRRPGRRARAVLRVLHPRHDLVDGVRPDARRSARSAAATTSGCTSTRRCPASPPWHPSSAGSTTGWSSPTRTAPTRTSGWASTSTATSTGPPTAAALLGALSILPEYLRSEAAEAGAVIDYRDWQIPLGRRFRALKLWFAIRCDGVASFQDDDPPPRRADPGTRRLGRRRRPVRDRRTRTRSTSVPRRCAATTTDAATDALIEAANATGEALFTRTVLDGRSVLRISIGARSTERHHVEVGLAPPPTLASPFS